MPFSQIDVQLWTEISKEQRLILFIASSLSYSKAKRRSRHKQKPMLLWENSKMLQLRTETLRPEDEAVINGNPSYFKDLSQKFLQFIFHFVETEI